LEKISSSYSAPEGKDQLLDNFLFELLHPLLPNQTDLFLHNLLRTSAHQNSLGINSESYRGAILPSCPVEVSLTALTMKEVEKERGKATHLLQLDEMQRLVL